MIRSEDTDWEPQTRLPVDYVFKSAFNHLTVPKDKVFRFPVAQKALEEGVFQSLLKEADF